MPILVEMIDIEGNRGFKIMTPEEFKVYNEMNPDQFGIYKASQEEKERVANLSISKAIKHDGDKPRYDLLPYDAIEKVVEVLTIGANKYSDRNWEQGLKYSRCFAALQRHLVAWFQKREDNDQETNTHHLANAACELLFLLSYEVRNTDINLDDRPVVNKPK